MELRIFFLHLYFFLIFRLKYLLIKNKRPCNCYQIAFKVHSMLDTEIILKKQTCSLNQTQENVCSLVLFVSLFLWQLVCSTTHWKKQSVWKSTVNCPEKLSKEKSGNMYEAEYIPVTLFLLIGKWRKNQGSPLHPYFFFFFYSSKHDTCIWEISCFFLFPIFLLTGIMKRLEL